jgi:outer membrane protein
MRVYNKIGAFVAVSAVALVGYTGLSDPQAGGPKLAYINSTVIIARAPGAAEAQATFERDMARWRSEVQALEDSLRQMIATYEQQQIMLSPERRQERQREIDQKRREYQQRTDTLQQVAQRRQQELVEPIFQNIRSVLVEIRAERDYAMIFDAAAGALIEADTTLDITGLVIERLAAQARR